MPIMPFRKKWWACPVCKHHKMVDYDCKYIQCVDCGNYFDSSGRKVSLNEIKPSAKCDVS